MKIRNLAISALVSLSMMSFSSIVLADEHGDHEGHVAGDEGHKKEGEEAVKAEKCEMVKKECHCDGKKADAAKCEKK
jgi:hypothetical protein